MSMNARRLVAARCVLSPDCVYGLADILDPAYTNTNLIAFLLDCTNLQPIEITMVRRGHHNDGPHGHLGGFALDCWPLKRMCTPSDLPACWLDAEEDAIRFAEWLQVCAKSPWRYQIGLAGSAYTTRNEMAANAFQDAGGDHVHLGARWN